MLRLDGLLFQYIYSDLMMLAKSVLDMNIQLKIFLDASMILKADLTPFASESCLYGTSPKTNHRLHKHYVAVRECLIAPTSNGDDPLFPALQAAAQAMLSKFCDYKRDQLPGDLLGS